MIVIIKYKAKLRDAWKYPHSSPDSRHIRADFGLHITDEVQNDVYGILPSQKESEDMTFLAGHDM